MDRLDAVWTITGDYSRAPQWMQDNGLEWVHRMVTQPRALLWRYVTTTPHALIVALRHSDKRVQVMEYEG